MKDAMISVDIHDFYNSADALYFSQPFHHLYYCITAMFPCQQCFCIVTQLKKKVDNEEALRYNQIKTGE